MTKRTSKQKGLVGLYLTIVVLVLMIGILTSIGFGVLAQQKIIQNTTQSAQAYFAAESGVEDALLRLQKGMAWVSSYSLQAGGAAADITISDPPLGGTRTITSQGDAQDRVRTVRVGYQLTTDDVSFNFGAHIGNPNIPCPPSCGGLEMEHNDSTIVGNVFSNATIFGKSSATITDSVTVAGVGNELQDVTVLGDAAAYACADATISGDLEYNSSGSNSCTVGGSVTTTGDVIATVDFPISDTKIGEWKAAAAPPSGEIVDGGGDVTIDANRSLGPGKITGNLEVQNGFTLTVTGTLWVTGTFSPQNGSIVELDDSYGSLSGALIADDTADIGNGVILRGSGTPGSFLAIVGTKASLAEATPAIAIANNSDNAILFAPKGIIVVKNNAGIVEVTAHKLLIKNATVTYDLGLASAKFSTGPGAGWRVTSWQEIE